MVAHFTTFAITCGRRSERGARNLLTSGLQFAHVSRSVGTFKKHSKRPAHGEYSATGKGASRQTAERRRGAEVGSRRLDGLGGAAEKVRALIQVGEKEERPTESISSLPFLKKKKTHSCTPQGPQKRLTDTAFKLAHPYPSSGTGKKAALQK